MSLELKHFKFCSQLLPLKWLRGSVEHQSLILGIKTERGRGSQSEWDRELRERETQRSYYFIIFLPVLFRDSIQLTIFLYELECLHINKTLNSFKSSNKEGLIRTLWRSHKEEPRVREHSMSKWYSDNNTGYEINEWIVSILQYWRCYSLD